MPPKGLPTSPRKPTPRRSTLLAAAAEQTDRKTILYGSSPRKTEQVPYWRVSASEGQSASEAVPHLRNGAQRRQNVIDNQPAIFPVAENPQADPSLPLYHRHVIGRDTVAKYSSEIEAAAKKYGVDPDLAKAIVYLENARGWYDTFAFGANKTIRPMNINVEMWEDLGVPAAQALDPKGNIDLGVRLIQRLVERVPNGSPAQIATLYNSLAKEKVSDYGAAVQQAYEQRLWERRRDPRSTYRRRERGSLD